MYRRLAILLFLLLPPAAQATQVHVAVASNFRPTLELLAKEWQSNHQLLISSASTGVLYAQIVHGAPYSLFLAADDKRPIELEQSGTGVNGSRFTYARGILALAAPSGTHCKLAMQLIANAAARSISIANPATAPFGQAAAQILGEVDDRVVKGENVAQALHMFASGNTQYSLTALSVLKHWQYTSEPIPASICPLDTSLYAPIWQQAVLLDRAKDNVAAKEFLVFLQSSHAQSLIEQAGYLREPM
ncbi:MAG: molybdate ABC transporter substrate-binding protein [Pseudomonadales bacterium]